MMAHGIAHILTLDAGGFERYQEIVAVRPRRVPKE
jgi:hypothetical protein